MIAAMTTTRHVNLGADVVVAPARPADAPEVARLAALDDAPFPLGPLLLATVDGRLVAALPLGGGRPIADPFTATDEVVALLRMRAEQIVSRARWLRQRAA